MASAQSLSKQLHPQIDSNPGKFSPLKRDHNSPLFSAEKRSLVLKLPAEKGSQLGWQKRSNPAPGKSFQRPRARDKKLTTQEVINIQVVGSSAPVENSGILLCEGDPTPQETRPLASERKRRELYGVARGKVCWGHGFGCNLLVSSVGRVVGLCLISFELLREADVLVESSWKMGRWTCRKRANAVRFGVRRNELAAATGDTRSIKW